QFSCEVDSFKYLEKYCENVKSGAPVLEIVTVTFWLPGSSQEPEGQGIVVVETPAVELSRQIFSIINERVKSPLSNIIVSEPLIIFQLLLTISI
ncbi:MAG: hypothetical protein UY36_C0017G0001, partial [Parcubacteria group bacterium GW2011_GWA1_49_11]